MADKKPVKKRSIIMDTLFGSDEPAPDKKKGEEANVSMLEGAKNFLFGKKALDTAAKKMKEKK